MFVLTLALAMQSAAVPAQPTASEKKVCRTSEDTGTRMGRRRICKTESDWERDKREAEDFARSRQLDIERPAGANPAPGL